jgi:hypothetical protein
MLDWIIILGDWPNWRAVKLTALDLASLVGFTWAINLLNWNYDCIIAIRLKLWAILFSLVNWPIVNFSRRVSITFFLLKLWWTHLYSNFISTLLKWPLSSHVMETFDVNWLLLEWFLCSHVIWTLDINRYLLKWPLGSHVVKSLIINRFLFERSLCSDINESLPLRL